MSPVPLMSIFTVDVLAGAQCGSQMTKGVLQLVASSDDAQNVARTLRTGEGMTRNHLSSAAAKTQAWSRTEAVRIANRNGSF